MENYTINIVLKTDNEEYTFEKVRFFEIDNGFFRMFFLNNGAVLKMYQRGYEDDIRGSANEIKAFCLNNIKRYVITKKPEDIECKN
jgi:hypothetical protein